MLCCSPGGQGPEAIVQGHRGRHGAVLHRLVGHLALEAGLQQIPGGGECDRCCCDLGAPGPIVRPADHQGRVTDQPLQGEHKLSSFVNLHI